MLRRFLEWLHLREPKPTEDELRRARAFLERAVADHEQPEEGISGRAPEREDGVQDAGGRRPDH